MHQIQPKEFAAIVALVPRSFLWVERVESMDTADFKNLEDVESGKVPCVSKYPLFTERVLGPSCTELHVISYRRKRDGAPDRGYPYSYDTYPFYEGLFAQLSPQVKGHPSRAAIICAELCTYCLAKLWTATNGSTRGVVPYKATCYFCDHGLIN